MRCRPTKSWPPHVEQRALDLRAVGLPGTLQELRVRAYLDLLQETDSRPAPGGNGGPEQDGGPGANGGSEPPASDPGPATGGTRHDAEPSVAALVTITVPLETMQGRSETPGEALRPRPRRAGLPARP